MQENTVFQEKKISKAIMAVAIPSMLGQLTTLIYNMVDTYFVALTKDPNQIAAVTLCAPLMLILLSVGLMFGTGGSSLIARYLGAKQEDKVKAVSSYCFYTTIIVSVIIVILGLVATSLGFLVQTVYYVVCMVNFNRNSTFPPAKLVLMLDISS